MLQECDQPNSLRIRLIGSDERLVYSNLRSAWNCKSFWLRGQYLVSGILRKLHAC